MANLVSHFLGLTKCRRGSTAVEFAMLMPIFVMMMFGIVVFGSYLAVTHGVQQLAAEAARSSIGGLTDTERSTLASSYVSQNAASYPLINPAHVSVNAAASPASSNVFLVTVNYDASDMFIYSLPAVLAPPTQITRTAAVPYGGF
jgi:Flp pilus assembly protein TadG